MCREQGGIWAKTCRKRESKTCSVWGKVSDRQMSKGRALRGAVPGSPSRPVHLWSTVNQRERVTWKWLEVRVGGTSNKGAASHSKDSGLYSECKGEMELRLESFEQTSDMIWLSFLKNLFSVEEESGKNGSKETS